MAQTLSVEEMIPAPFTPKMKRHFIFAIEGIDAYLIKTASRPNSTVGEVELQWLNESRYVAGKRKFETINLTLHDPIGPSGMQQVQEWLRLVQDEVSGRGGYPDFYKRDCQIKITDAVGNVVELWDIKGAFPTTVNGGDLSYASENDMNEISITIRFDKAVQQF